MNSEAAQPILESPVTVCILFYGDYPKVATRCLTSLLQNTERSAYRLRLGLNSVSEATESAIAQLLPHFDVEMIVRSPVNLYKCPMMRRLFHDQPIETSWTIWFDDDSYVHRNDWLQMLMFQSRLNPSIDMWGKRCFIRGTDAHRNFIRRAPWYRGLIEEPDDRPGHCRLNFAVGGFWAIRTEWIYRLDWPEPRLLQFGEDYILGEALRQNGAQIGNAFSGVAIDRAPRRIPSNTPRCEALF